MHVWIALRRCWPVSCTKGRHDDDEYVPTLWCIHHVAAYGGRQLAAVQS